MAKLVIIKLGGSVITQKDASEATPRLDVIKRLSVEIAGLHKGGKWKMILVHGAGSFGHPLARKYGLANGMDTADARFGFCLTDHMMVRLNSIVIDALLNNNIPAIGFPPRAFISQSGGTIKKLNDNLIKLSLSHNQVPVLFGDVVLDDKQGCSILSGDTIISFLAKKMEANKVIFLSDVDGVYDKDPTRYKDAKKIEFINDQNLKDILKGVSMKNEGDVTGEMKGKILRIKENLSNIETVVASGLLKNHLTNAMRGRMGTRLLFG